MTKPNTFRHNQPASVASLRRPFAFTGTPFGFPQESPFTFTGIPNIYRTGLGGAADEGDLALRDFTQAPLLMVPLRASLRVHVAAIAVLLCLTMAFVALTSKEAAPRVFGGVFFPLITGVAVAEYRKETSLAEGHLVSNGTITELKTGTRGRRSVNYQFVALDGKQYQGECDWGTQKVSVGSEIPVLYPPLDPTVNVPLKRFLFYSFQAVAS